MPLVGICRYGRDNDYLFVAEDESKSGLLTNVSLFHMSNATFGMAFKSQYPTAELAHEDRALITRGGNIFSGDDLIHTYLITPEVYRDIFDHSRDHERHLEFVRGKLESGYTFSLGWELRETIGKSPATSDQIEAEFERIRRELTEHPLRDMDIEYDRALTAAHNAGFPCYTVNGHPRAVGSIVNMNDLV